MRNKKTKKIGGSQVQTANLLGDVKPCLGLRLGLKQNCIYRLIETHILSLLCLIPAASIHPLPRCVPPRRLPSRRGHAAVAPLLRLRRPSLLPLLRRLEATGHRRLARPAPSRNLGALPGRRAIPKPRRPSGPAHPEALPPPTRGTPSSTPGHPKAVHC
jgi:hypothetical protein